MKKVSIREINSEYEKISNIIKKFNEQTNCIVIENVNKKNVKYFIEQVKYEFFKYYNIENIKFDYEIVVRYESGAKNTFPKEAGIIDMKLCNDNEEIINIYLNCKAADNKMRKIYTYIKNLQFTILNEIVEFAKTSKRKVVKASELKIDSEAFLYGEDYSILLLSKEEIKEELQIANNLIESFNKKNINIKIDKISMEQMTTYLNEILAINALVDREWVHDYQNGEYRIEISFNNINEYVVFEMYDILEAKKSAERLEYLILHGNQISEVNLYNTNFLDYSEDYAKGLNYCNK